MSVPAGVGGRGFVGLDLSVLDSFTGVARPASSLSGGEKFLASISLALGLSDVIVERAGGVALDSIFIDEGFGSLDDETLDRAMAALDRVRGERVIGIVSHVAELKNRVPVRVEVVKSSSGSSLRVVR
jgi:exonuclease SbcC